MAKKQIRSNGGIRGGREGRGTKKQAVTKAVKHEQNSSS